MVLWFEVHVARLRDESWQIVGVECDLSSCQLPPHTLRVVTPSRRMENGG